MHEVISSPFLGDYLAVRPGSGRGLKIPRRRYHELMRNKCDYPCPEWLVDAVRRCWPDLDLAGPERAHRQRRTQLRDCPVPPDRRWSDLRQGSPRGQNGYLAAAGGGDQLLPQPCRAAPALADSEMWLGPPRVRAPSRTPRGLRTWLGAAPRSPPRPNTPSRCSPERRAAPGPRSNRTSPCRGNRTWPRPRNGGGTTARSCGLRTYDRPGPSRCRRSGQ